LQSLLLFFEVEQGRIEMFGVGSIEIFGVSVDLSSVGERVHSVSLGDGLRFGFTDTEDGGHLL